MVQFCFSDFEKMYLNPPPSLPPLVSFLPMFCVHVLLAMIIALICDVDQSLIILRQMHKKPAGKILHCYITMVAAAQQNRFMFADPHQSFFLPI